MLSRLIVLLSLVFCISIPAAFAGPTNVSLEYMDSSTSSQVLVRVNIVQPDAHLRAVLADLRIDYDADVIEFVEVRGMVEGKKAFAAPIKSGPLRLTLTGVTLDPIKSGAVATLVFKVKPATTVKRTTLRLTDDSKLAPRAAGSDLRLAPPLTVELGKGRQK